MRAAWLFLSTTLAGCHLVFPFGQQTSAATDGAADARDLLMSGESSPDAMPDDLVTCTTDQATPLLVAECQDNTCATGGDCDALPEYRDHFDGCNRLLYEETFDADPRGGRWLIPSGEGEDWSWSCGALAQTSTEDLFRWASATDAVLTSADYLVEARIVLGPTGDLTKNPRWGVGIAGRVGWDAATGHHTYALCELWVNPDPTSGNPVYSPDVHMMLKNPATDTHPNPDFRSEGIGAWPLPHVATPGLEGKAGDVIYLQLWYTTNLKKIAPATPCSTNDCPALVCIACDESKCLRGGSYAFYTDQTHLQYLPQEPGTVGLRTLNRAASYDYVRVFELTDP